jgi:hypothetical protein
MNSYINQNLFKSDGNTSQRFLEYYGKHILNIPRFLGVFASDKQPPNLNIGDSYIVNYQTSKDSRGGSHWVAVKIISEDAAEVMDPSGIAIPDLEVEEHLKQRGIERSDIHTGPDFSLQEASDGRWCGEISIGFLASGLPLDIFTQRIDPNNVIRGWPLYEI